MVSATATADVIVIGDGLIGLSTAWALGRQGARCVVVGTSRPGVASIASAGLLVPSIGQLGEAVRPFFVRSLALYPAFVADLAAHDADLRIIEGMIERDGGVDTLHPTDGAIDNVRLLGALRMALAGLGNVGVESAEVESLSVADHGCSVTLSIGVSLSAARVVLAAGAWSPAIRGIPRRLPVEPLKGQMLALSGCPLTRPVMGPEVYLVPRGNETLVGATVEIAGFDTTVTPEAVAWLRKGAVELFPELAASTVTRAWAGIRPATPDMLPIIGPDPDAPRVIYACGHAKNGVLLAPATAEAVADCCHGRPASPMLAPFAPTRFEK